MSGVQTPGGRGDHVAGSMLGAAVGDALGWPQARQSRNIRGNRRGQGARVLGFQSWPRRRREGSARYQDPVSAGEYSDHTQLLLAVGRACLRDDDWYPWLTEVELPQWTLYQREGRGAVLRAARSWQAGKPPWTLAKTKKKKTQATGYFSAGGNSAATRIAPHVLKTTGVADIPNLAGRVVRDSIATHGHPRAILGALIHAIALCYAQHQPATLEHGELVDAITDETSWRPIDVLFENVNDTWILNHQLTADQYSHEWTDIATRWRETVQEIDDSLQTIKTNLDQASPESDHNVLEVLGAFDNTISGAGTVSALASLYLATRYASSPASGLVQAAYLTGADTDALASMAGSLWGTVHGTYWLASLDEYVQDSQYISWLGEALLSTDPTIQPRKDMPVDQKALRGWSEELFQSTNTDVLPDGRKITLERHSLLAASRKKQVSRVVATTEDGQTLTIDRETEAAVATRGQPLSRESDTHQAQTVTPSNLTHVEIKVADLSATRSFYEKVLQLPGEYSDHHIRLAGNLMITQAGATTLLPTENGPIIHVYGDPDAVFERAQDTDDIATRLSDDRRTLWLKNADGHRVRIEAHRT